LSLAFSGAARAAEVLRAAVLAFILLAIGGGVAHADQAHPLKPIPTGSPRETLLGFLEATDQIYRLRTESLAAYADSGEGFIGEKEVEAEATLADLLPRAVGALDLSRVSPILRETVGPESVVLLREVLDRIDLPDAAQIPDAAEMARLGEKKWRIPDTEIDFVLIEKGPRAGQYLVAPETVARLREFYAEVRKLPDRSQVTLGLIQAVKNINLDQSGTVYDIFLNSPAGLSRIVPLRWLLSMPAWTKARVFDLAVWQWLGLAFGMGLGALLLWAVVMIKRRWKRARRNPDSPRYYSLLIPLVAMLAAGEAAPLLFSMLRIGGIPRVVLAYGATLVTYLAAAWLCLLAVILLGEAIIESEHIKTRSLDGQLFRLGARFVGAIGASAILVKGADALGLPAYSVVAGLGVGGLAVALAARDSLANLLGSILIMFEKPFRIGHQIRLSGNTGKVVDVGFRSTRLRTLDNSLISIPNNDVVNATVENLSARNERRQRFLVQVTYDTPREKLTALLEGIRKLIAGHPFADSTNFHVRLNDLGESSLDILVIFHIMTEDYGEELQQREDVLLRIMDLAAELGVSFAFPTRTVQVESLPSGSRPV
jgi:MscS family membrane protein